LLPLPCSVGVCGATSILGTAAYFLNRHSAMRCNSYQ
jgi:hypothetical protein